MRSAHGSSPPDTLPRHDAFPVASQELAERRTINVYTPPGYQASHRAFPVLYMLDGGLAEDFPNVVTTVDSLIRLKRIPPIIVVGIENTERRRDLIGPTVVGTDSAIAPRVGGWGLAWEYDPRPDLEHGTIFRARAPGALVKAFK